MARPLRLRCVTHLTQASPSADSPTQPPPVPVGLSYRRPPSPAPVGPHPSLADHRRPLLRLHRHPAPCELLQPPVPLAGLAASPVMASVAVGTSGGSRRRWGVVQMESRR
ncbi:hypothetical protein RHMOL_Rhmol01G0318400 [Rhododendron molle]|uniref:Uncharacterized protein n=1 Tax=Rhododendron molle TaxID=49168 RepID=A0ACC0Q7J5_RHOML|nr:hypothetical protein RHMOL_Rhmol01G0318400 [Rhododendron molle]